MPGSPSSVLCIPRDHASPCNSYFPMNSPGSSHATILSAHLGLATGPEKKPTFNDWGASMILPSLFYIVNFFPVAFKCRQRSLLRNKTLEEAATHSPCSLCSISLFVLTMKLTQTASLLAAVSSLPSSFFNSPNSGFWPLTATKRAPVRSFLQACC